MFQIAKDWGAEPKFRELVLYVCDKSRLDPKFGAVKLNKILYYADFAAHRQLGQSISGDEYQRLDEGPAPRHLLPLRRALLEEGAAVLREVEVFNHIQQRLEPKGAVRLQHLSAEEVVIVDNVLEELRPMNGTEVSVMSHREIGWRVTVDRETIPYSTAWLSAEPLSQAQLEVGLEIAERHGLLATG